MGKIRARWLLDLILLELECIRTSLGRFLTLMMKVPVLKIIRTILIPCIDETGI